MILLYFAAGLLLLLPIGWLFLRRYMGYLVEQRISDYQNELVAKHCAEVENIYKQMRGWRHDYHNHIQAMTALADLQDIATIRDYLLKLNGDVTQIDAIIKTGNVMADAILNSKISLAKARKISVNGKAAVPKNLTVSEVDLCVIIGNLLDNAIEGCMKLTEEKDRFIRIYIGVHKELFYISVSNSAGGEIKKSGASYLSTKNKPNHGFGLVRIDKIAEKYGGFVDRQNEPGVFATEIMLPL